LEQMLDAPGGQDAPQQLRATALGALGALIRLQGDTDLATLRSAQALALSRTLDDPYDTAAFALNSLGLLAKDRGDLPMATRYFEESLTCRRAAGDRHGLGYSLANLASAVQLQGDHVRAHRLLEESLAVRRAVGDQLGVMQSLQALARLARDGPDRQGTVALLRASLSLAWTLGDPRGIATSLEGLAAVAVRDGQAAWAVRLVGAAARVYAAGEFMPPPHDRADREHTLAAAWAGLGAEAFRAAWAAGQALTPEQVIVEVLTLLPAPLGRPVASPE
jgi:tetratricopeptide (TPR) repeat protein